MNRSNPLRVVAGIQTDIAFASREANQALITRWLEDERVAAADLIVFPECALSGYCFESLDEALPHAETIPGPTTKAIAEVCRAQEKYTVFGMLERGENHRLYNTCVLIGPQGVVGKYRKIHLPFLGVDRFTSSGDEPYRVFDIDGMKIGMHICYDGIFPESGRVLALEGADVLVLPTNWPPGADTFAKYIPHARALENNVYFLAVNRIGTERGFRFIGQSRLCDTNGNALSEANHIDESLIMGTIDLEKARNKRLVKVPGKHIVDRWRDRHPEFYGRIVS